MSALLEIEDLDVHFPLPLGLSGLVSKRLRRTVRAVDGVSLALDRGETLGLVGESGCGKTTLGRAALHLIRATGGAIRFDGEDIGSLKGERLKAFHRRAQMIFQDPHSSLNPLYSVGRTLREVLEVHKLCPPAEMRGRIAELLIQVGLQPELIDRRPAALSGGQCQRVGIARALAVEPELIVADESVSALDVSIQAQVLNLLMQLQRELHLTMLFISHDLAVVRHLCQRVAVMYLGRIVELGPTEEIFAAPKHPYTVSLIEAIPRMTPDARLGEALLSGEPPSPIDVPDGCAFHPRCDRAMDQCRNGIVPALRSLGTVGVRCHLYGDGTPAQDVGVASPLSVR